jgi:iron-sulfur cluster assembly protein
MANEIKINITTEAINKAKELIDKDKNSIGLRVEIQKGGCSGMTYNVLQANKINEQDEIVKKDGVNFIIAPSAILFLIGCTIDWKKEKFKNGFTFENPNETARCGCGESFSVS